MRLSRWYIGGVGVLSAYLFYGIFKNECYP